MPRKSSAERDAADLDEIKRHETKAKQELARKQQAEVRLKLRLTKRSEKIGFAIMQESRENPEAARWIAEILNRRITRETDRAELKEFLTPTERSSPGKCSSTE